MNDVLSEVVQILTDVVGEDFPPDARIGPATTFGDDIGLESIEFVALADRLRTRYGDHVDFPGFLADLDLDEITNLTVGDVVDHITERERAHVSASGPSAAPSEGDR
ncbi:acyl carrier protein [Actinomadura pelletieri DSM 43383]|uniref:Acyl carrier protein n=1 Tax=Actinomadura pelletieri DSM 43383 TaxID=1120940 RepID=A0A495QB67_9ACTN|nr:acyl carrier protein [Actinomadura pelletieri]RKS68744.1 acyl carrier protein [Actinomadura pelletieri DSM 43383]